jgi:glycosyltransferase involved in cell wall biosynthesis
MKRLEEASVQELVKSTKPAIRVAWLGHKSVKGGDGITTYSREITNELKKHGLKVLFFHQYVEGDQETDESIPLPMVQLFHPRMQITTPKARKELLNTLKNHLVDIVHVSVAFSTLDFRLPNICHELGIPIVATFHVPFDKRISVWKGITTAIYRAYATALADYDKVIIFTDVQKQMLINMGVPAEKIEIIPNGVDIEKYSPGRGTFKASVEAKTLITYMGRLDPEKNVDALIRAFKDLNLDDSIKLAIVGGGSEKKSLEKKFSSDNVIFTGPIADEKSRIDILRSSDIFVLPSSIEGLSLAMLEAMACGVATIATDVGGDGEALRGAGIVIEPTELESQLHLALDILLSFPEFRSQIAAYCRDRVVSQYSLAMNVSKLLDVYIELISGRS